MQKCFIFGLCISLILYSYLNSHAEEVRAKIVKFQAAYRHFEYLKGKCVTAVGVDNSNDNRRHKDTHLDSRHTLTSFKNIFNTHHLNLT